MGLGSLAALTWSAGISVRKLSMLRETELSAASTNFFWSGVMSFTLSLSGKYSRIWIRLSTAVLPYCVAAAICSGSQ